MKVDIIPTVKAIYGDILWQLTVQKAESDALRAHIANAMNEAAPAAASTEAEPAAANVNMTDLAAKREKRAAEAK